MARLRKVRLDRRRKERLLVSDASRHECGGGGGGHVCCGGHGIVITIMGEFLSGGGLDDCIQARMLRIEQWSCSGA